MLIVRGHAMKGIKKFFGKEFMVIILIKTRVTSLIMLWAHEEDHGGVDTMLLTATHMAWS